MKAFSKHAKRLLALALVFVLLMSNMSGLSLTASAAYDASKTIASVVAENYDLSEAEKALLNSGLLAGGSMEYKVPEAADELIAVDTDNKLIEAEKYENFVPMYAQVVVGGNIEEIVTLTDGKGTYTYDGNAFSVIVYYDYSVSVDTALQEQLLNTGAWLKQGVANLDAVSAQAGNLYILEEAMPSLVDFANNGVKVEIMGNTSSVGFSDICKAAVNALNDQMTANGGKLNLSTMVEQYDAGKKTNYLLNGNGKAMQAEVADLYAKVSEINTALTTMVDNLSIFIDKGWVTEDLANQLKTLAGVCKNLVDGLAAVNADEWKAANMGATTLLNVAGSSWKIDLAKAAAQLDTLVAALGEKTEVAVKETLKVDATSIQHNLAMFDVTVNFKLNQIVNNIPALNSHVESVVLTLAKDASKAEIVAAIEASGAEAAALAAWGIDTAYFTRSEVSGFGDEDKLAEDIKIEYFYNPNTYTVTYGYAEAEVRPYGYVITLPEHSNSALSYDYKVNGTAYAQGSKITVSEDMEITRTEGKSYTKGNLYNIIADNYGNDKTSAILKSGALNGNEAVNVRYPGAEDAEALLKLDGKLTAANYDASYNSLYWNPYSYGANGDENIFSGNEGAWAADEANVIYRLNLTNYSAAKVEEVLALAETLASEAAGQKSTMDAFASYYATMGQLDKTKLGALNGVIDVTDFTPGDGTDTDAKNLELRAYFKTQVSGIINENLASNNYLKIYNILGEYKAGGLEYYYENSAEIIAEIDSLSARMSALLADEEKEAALAIMVSAAGFPEYVEKIADIEGAMASVQANLTAPNAAINTGSDKLADLVAALTMEGSTGTTATPTSPYLTSGKLMVVSSAKRTVTVQVSKMEGGLPLATELYNWSFDRDYVIAQTDADAFAAKAVELAEIVLGADKAKFYNVAADDVNALVGSALAGNTTISYKYTVKEYTVKIDGEADQTITIDSLQVKLPACTKEGFSYTYVIDGKEYGAGNYNFTAEQLAALFTDGSYTITRTENDLGAQALENFVAKLNESVGKTDAFVLVEEGGAYTGITGSISVSDFMGFAMGLVNGGYSYVGLNGEGFLYFNAENSLELSIQTLINAILKDNSFSDETIVALGENGKGKLVAASLQLGGSADEIVYSDLDFVLNLNSVPSQLTSNVDSLKTVFNYVSFQSNNGVLDLSVSLPDQVYAAYAAALITTGYVEKDDVNGIEQAVAIQFLIDYVDAVVNCGADMDTFANTVAQLGKNVELSSYNGIYNGAVKAYNEYMTIDAATGAVAIDLPGKTVIDALMNLGNVDASSMSTYLGMLKEYKDDGKILADGKVALTNLDKTYYALIVDAQASGLANKAEAPASYEALSSELATLAGYSAVILTADVPGSLTVAGTTVLDLNGFDVNGDIKSTGTLYIVDSGMDTAAAGSVSGAVSGNVSIFGGNYTADVTAFLKDGYKQVNGNVQNALYTISEDDGNVTFNLNTGVVTDDITSYTNFAKAVAVDLAADIVLNYYTSAALSVDTNGIYDVNVEDLIALLKSGSKVNAAIDIVLDAVNVPGIGEFIETVINDMLDFEAVNAALESGKAIASYTLTTEPWEITVDKAAEDYLAVGIGSNDAKAKTFTVSLEVSGEYVDNIVAITSQLADIKAKGEVDIVLENIVRDGNTIPAKGSIDVTVSADLTASEKHASYITAIAAVIGDKALIDALNANDDVNAKAVQDAFNNITVKAIFDAAKALNRNDSFAAKAAAAGLTYDKAELAELDAAYKLVVCAVGKALEKLDITGPSTEMGAFADGEGAYTYEKNNVNRTPSFSVRGYTVTADLTASGDVSLTIFGEATTPDDPDDPVVPDDPDDPVVPDDPDDPTPGNPEPDVDENGCAHYNPNCGVKCHVELYSDLSCDKWYHAYIDYVVCRGLMIGIDEGIFAPNMTTTRAMIVTTLYRIENCPEVEFTQDYDDVAAGLWYSDAIAWATANGIVEGYGNGKFGPRDTVTREQMATILYRYIDYKGYNVDVEYDLSEYKDAESVHAWAQDAMEWAVGVGMINGISETEKILDPIGGTARSHVAALLTRLCLAYLL